MAAPLHEKLTASDPFETLGSGADLATDPNWTAFDGTNPIREQATLADVYLDPAGANRALYGYNGTAPGSANYSSKATFGGLVNVPTLQWNWGPAARVVVNGASYDGYIADYRSDTGLYQIRRYNAGVAATLQTGAGGGAPVDGTTLRLQCVTNGAGNVELAVFKNDADPAILTVTDDAAGKLTAVGVAGIFGYHAPQAGTRGGPITRDWQLYEPAEPCPGDDVTEHSAIYADLTSARNIQKVTFDASPLPLVDGQVYTVCIEVVGVDTVTGKLEFVDPIEEAGSELVVRVKREENA